MRYLYAVFIAALSTCSQVKPDTGDRSKPEVTIRFQDSGDQYVTVGKASLPAGAGSREVLCTVNEPGGVSFISLTFSAAAGACTVGGQIVSGHVTIPTPPDQVEDVKPGVLGKVPTERFFLATVKGPFTCTVPGKDSSVGAPVGATITATCTGKNWSDSASTKTARAKLAIELN